jgi:DNA polymerase III alpha subunit (gram-positive type)
MIKRLWIDFETTGLDPAECGLTQLAYIIEDHEGKILDMGDFNIKPFEGAEISRKALEVTGKTYEEIFEYEEEGIVLDLFLEVLTKHINPLSRDENFTIAGYNVQFDMRFLDEWMQRHNKKFFSYFNYHTVDPLAIMRILRFEEETNLPSLKLSSVYKAIFEKDFDAHNAIADILATKDIYYYLLEHHFTLKRR